MVRNQVMLMMVVGLHTVESMECPVITNRDKNQ